METAIRAISVAVLLLTATTAFAADDVASFYSGKRVALLIGAEGGGGTDVAGRLMAKHIGKHIPGQPAVVPQNMQGAGSLRLTNYLANVAPRDGATFGLLVRGVIQQPILGDPAAKFDPLALTWIGTISSGGQDAYLLVIRKATGIKTVADLRNTPTAITLGSSGGNSTNMVFAKLSNDLFGFKTRLIQGFHGTNSVMLAVQRGEIDGIYSTLMTLSNDSSFRSGELTAVAQAGRSTRHPNYPDVPLLSELTSNPADAALLAFVESIFPVSLPFAAPPEIPADNAKALEKAFLDTCNDPAFRADAERLNMELSPLGGQAIRDGVAKMMKTSPAVIARYKTLIEVQ